MENRVGEISTNNQGLKMEIIKYVKNDDIDVRFENGFIKHHVRYDNYARGKVYNPSIITVYGIGILGTGDYKTNNNGLPTREYKAWQDMLKRCYKSKAVAYKNCIVSDEWKNFQKFAEWYDNNYYSIQKDTLEIDKDILIKHNRIYSDKTCLIVPRRINNLFIKQKAQRNSLPIGVCFSKENTRHYLSYCRGINGKENYLGSFFTAEESFHTYKLFKEKIIKEIANEYKSIIPIKVYNALINYRVEIDD